MTPVDRLQAIEEIRQLRARYWLGIDTRDAAMLRGVFSTDAVIPAHGDIKQTRIADDFVAVVIRGFSNSKTLHHGGPGVITFQDDDNATGVWAMEDYIWNTAPSAALPFMKLHGWGHYHDNYRRTPEGWRIQSFILERLRVETEGAAAAAIPAG